MSAYKSEFLQVLASRGFIHQVSEPDKLDALAASGMITAYVGYDATASSLHIGNLLTITMLRWLQKTGHRPIALMGGGTSKIGDPSGKDATRTLLTPEQINANIASIQTVFAKFLDFGGGPNGAVMANNADWLDSLAYIPFLRDVGRHFTINKMLTFDSVKLRLDREQPLTFLEFNYMILQAYDFAELNKRHGCILQMGGSDQWGNIVNGIDLGRRLLNAELFALTTPLLTTASGQKMGKTESGAVWLNADMMRPYDYWQFWRNCEDADTVKLLKLFTDLPLDEIGRLAALEGGEINEAKKILATEATALLHGRAAAEAAAANRAADLRGRHAGRQPADRRGAARRAGEGHRRAHRVRGEDRSRRLQQRGAPSGQGGRPAGQRSGGDRRQDDAHPARADARRRDQALARAKAAYSAEAELRFQRSRSA